MGVIEFDPASELLSKALFLSFLEFLEPFFLHCLQCEVHKPPEARSPLCINIPSYELRRRS